MRTLDFTLQMYSVVINYLYYYVFVRKNISCARFKAKTKCNRKLIKCSGFELHNEDQTTLQVMLQNVDDYDDCVLILNKDPFIFNQEIEIRHSVVM